MTNAMRSVTTALIPSVGIIRLGCPPDGSLMPGGGAIGDTSIVGSGSGVGLGEGEGEGEGDGDSRTASATGGAAWAVTMPATGAAPAPRSTANAVQPNTAGARRELPRMRGFYGWRPLARIHC